MRLLLPGLKRRLDVPHAVWCQRFVLCQGFACAPDQCCRRFLAIRAKHKTHKRANPRVGLVQPNGAVETALYRALVSLHPLLFGSLLSHEYLDFHIALYCHKQICHASDNYPCVKFWGILTD